MNKPQIFLDMDGVLYDLNDLVRIHVNEDFKTNYPKNHNQSYWFSDYKNIPKPYFELLLEKKGIFYEGSPINKSIEVVNQLYQDGYDIHIITKPQINQYCFQEKTEWIKKWFPWFDIDTHFHTSGNKGLFANENRILIDDDINHLNSWKENGGVAICFGNYGWNKEWKGIKADNWEDIYKIVKNIR